MYHDFLSEPPPIIVRHETALLVSPLCDSPSKHVERAVREEGTAGTKAPVRPQPPRLAGLVGQRCSTIASGSFESDGGKEGPDGEGEEVGGGQSVHTFVNPSLLLPLSALHKTTNRKIEPTNHATHPETQPSGISNPPSV